MLLARASTVTAAMAALLGACAAAPERGTGVPAGPTGDVAAEAAPTGATGDVAAEAAPTGDVAAEAVPTGDVAGEDAAAEVEVVVLEPAPSSEDEVVCTREVVTGTHRPREVCQTRAQRRQERAAAQDWMRSGGRSGQLSRVPTVR